MRMVCGAPSLLRHHAKTNQERKHIMAAQASRLKVSKVGAVTQVEFVDRNILDESNIQQIGEELAVVVDEVPTPMIMIRFGNVQHLSSAALGALITINNRVKGKVNLIEAQQKAELTERRRKLAKMLSQEQTDYEP